MHSPCPAAITSASSSSFDLMTYRYGPMLSLSAVNRTEGAVRKSARVAWWLACKKRHDEQVGALPR
jgi:hypothetical protein